MYGTRVFFITVQRFTETITLISIEFRLSTYNIKFFTSVIFQSSLDVIGIAGQPMSSVLEGRSTARPWPRGA